MTHRKLGFPGLFGFGVVIRKSTWFRVIRQELETTVFRFIGDLLFNRVALVIGQMHMTVGMPPQKEGVVGSKGESPALARTID